MCMGVVGCKMGSEIVVTYAHTFAERLVRVAEYLLRFCGHTVYL